jgi:hypothetical protein
MEKNKNHQASMIKVLKAIILLRGGLLPCAFPNFQTALRL